MNMRNVCTLLGVAILAVVLCPSLAAAAHSSLHPTDNGYGAPNRPSSNFDSGARVVTVSDDQFNDADWFATVYAVSGGATQTVAQHATGGNPGAFRYMTHTMPAPGGVYIFHRYVADAYDPSAQGAITSS